MFNYSKGDYIGLSNYLLGIDFTPRFQSHDVQEIWCIIEQFIINAMKLFIPLTKIHSHQHPLWFTPEIRHQLKCLRTLHCKYKCHPTTYMAAKIKSLESGLQDDITAAKYDFESFVIKSFACTSNNKIYRYIKSPNKSKSLPVTVSFDSLVASADTDKANCYFHSVFSGSSSLPSTDDLPEISHSLNAIEFTETEVFQVLTTLDPNKASGIDSISPRILQTCATALYKLPVHIVTEKWSYSCSMENP